MENEKVLRVFPRRTNASPDDANARFGLPTFFDEADRILVSVTFDTDIEKGERLAKEWECVAPVEIGGPALGDPGGEFTPGMFVKNGFTVTSRGCPNSCWFCRAWRNEGHKMRTLKIKDGYNILDNNILACPDWHVKKVFAMLKRQKERPRFTGGFESKILKLWHIDYIKELNPSVMWFAYDTPDDYEPLVHASKLLTEANIIRKSSHASCCYVLIGWKNDTFDEAEKRLQQVVELGFFPQAMLFNSGVHFDDGLRRQWKRFARTWANKIIVGFKIRKHNDK